MGRARTRKLQRKKRSTRRRRGKSMRRRTRHMRGGFSLANMLSGLPLGQDLVNVARVMTTGARNVVRGFKGVPSAPSPLPTKGQFSKKLKFKQIAPPNIAKIRKRAISDVDRFEKGLK